MCTRCGSPEVYVRGRYENFCEDCYDEHMDSLEEAAEEMDVSDFRGMIESDESAAELVDEARNEEMELSSIEGGGIYLPAPQLGEERTHVDCPVCDTGEVPIRAEDTHRCRSCREEFKLCLRPVES